MGVQVFCSPFSETLRRAWDPSRGGESVATEHQRSETNTHQGMGSATMLGQKDRGSLMTTMQATIAQELGVKPQIVPHEEIQHRVTFLREYLIDSGAEGFVLGISGGQDSCLAGRLCQMAVEELRARNSKPYVFIALRLPYGIQHDEADAQRALEFIGPDRVYTVNIQAAVDGAVSAFEAATGMTMSDYNKGNQKAQQRMTVHYRMACQFNLLVVGTDHAAEAVTGFFTKFGDGGVDVTPLSGLSKRQGRQLLEVLGADQKILNKVPTADLLDARPGQTDETELGLGYPIIDDFLEGREVSDEAAAMIIRRYQATRHKRHLPVTPWETWWRES